MKVQRKEVAVPHTQYHPHDVPTPEPDDDEVELAADDIHDGLVPPDISDDPEHDRLIDPQD
jgi:DNA-directed RNA polymerase subunit K/omega